MVIAILALVAAMHPLHTTMTELTIDESRHSVRAVVRVFANDFSNAARRYPSADAYTAAAVSIIDGRGVVALHSCGTRRAADVLFVCTEGTFTGAARSLRISNALLFELFADQVNVVQISLGSNRHTVLFTHGDRMKSAIS